MLAEYRARKILKANNVTIYTKNKKMFILSQECHLWKFIIKTTERKKKINR